MHSPDSRATEMPSGFKKQYYGMFCSDWQAGVLTGQYYRTKYQFTVKMDAPPSNFKSLFYRVWRTEFSQLKVPKRHNRFSKCDWCVILKSNMESARQAHDLEEVMY
jgi:hypothetical protein